MAPIQAIFAPSFLFSSASGGHHRFCQIQVLLMSLVLVEASFIISKLASATGETEGKPSGLPPVASPGEVSLIFASLGKTLGLLTDNLCAVIVIVIVATHPSLPAATKMGPLSGRNCPASSPS